MLTPLTYISTYSGVLKTEIDPLQPKVTVLGNVDSKILIKRLLKAGKQAELWNQGNNNAGKEKKEHDMLTTNEKDRSKPETEQVKHLGSCGNGSDKRKDKKSTGDAGDIKDSKKGQKEANTKMNSSNTTEVVKSEKQPPNQAEVSDVKYLNLQDLGNFKTNNQYYYKVEPYAVPLPYYTIAAYPVPTVLPVCYSQESLQYEKPICQPPFQAPVTRVGDYFSDENTLGCYIM